MDTFELENYDFIELNKLLKIMQLVNSGGEAKQVIDEGMVTLNGAIEKQRRKKLRIGDKIEFGGKIVEIK